MSGHPSVREEIESAFGFLEAFGFLCTEREAPEGYAGGERVTLQGNDVRLDIVLDQRGEIDAYVTRADTSYPVSSFMPPTPPQRSIFSSAGLPASPPPRPPFMFGGERRAGRPWSCSQSTSRPTPSMRCKVTRTLFVLPPAGHADSRRGLSAHSVDPRRSPRQPGGKGGPAILRAARATPHCGDPIHV